MPLLTPTCGQVPPTLLSCPTLSLTPSVLGTLACPMSPDYTTCILPQGLCMCCSGCLPIVLPAWPAVCELSPRHAPASQRLESPWEILSRAWLCPLPGYLTSPTPDSQLASLHPSTVSWQAYLLLLGSGDTPVLSPTFSFTFLPSPGQWGANKATESHTQGSWSPPIPLPGVSVSKTPWECCSPWVDGKGRHTAEPG